MDAKKSEELKRLLACLNELEETQEVKALSFREMQVWPLIKMKLYWYLGLNTAPSAQLKSGRALAYLVHAFKDAIHFIASCRHLKRVDFLFSSATANRRSRIEGRYFDYYLDPIAEELRQEGHTGLFLETNPPDLSYRDKSPPYSRSIKLNLLRKTAILLSKLRAATSVRAELEPGLQTVLLALRKQGYFLPDSVVEQIFRQVRMEYDFSRFFGLVLNRIRPRAVFAVCFYAKWGEAFACHQRGIKFIDVQHGAQGNAHPAYSLWKHRYNTLPDLFWNWNPSDSETIRNWGGTAYLGGNPFSRLLKRNPGILEDYVSRLRACNPNGKIGVTVTLQPDMDFSYLGRIGEFSDFFFYVRLHPVMPPLNTAQVRKLLKESRSNNYEIDLSSTSPIQAVLLASQLHLTVDSYTVSEATELGLHSICLGAHSPFLHKTFMDGGTAHYLDDFSRFSSLASTLLTKLINRNDSSIYSIHELLSQIAN